MCYVIDRFMFWTLTFLQQNEYFCDVNVNIHLYTANLAQCHLTVIQLKRDAHCILVIIYYFYTLIYLYCIFEEFILCKSLVTSWRCKRHICNKGMKIIKHLIYQILPLLSFCLLYQLPCTVKIPGIDCQSFINTLLCCGAFPVALTLCRFIRL